MGNRNLKTTKGENWRTSYRRQRGGYAQNIERILAEQEENTEKTRQ